MEVNLVIQKIKTIYIHVRIQKTNLNYNHMFFIIYITVANQKKLL